MRPESCSPAEHLLRLMSPTNAADLRFVQIGTLALRIHDTDPGAVIAALTARRRQAPDLLNSARLLLDLGSLDGRQLEAGQIQALVSALAEQGHDLLGLSDNPTAAALAGDVGLPILKVNAERPEPTRKPDPKPAPEPTPESAQWNATRHIDGQIRSGQQIYARGSDLVIFGSVSPGAEVIADGSIHVYGVLRGRALAGASGHDQARIFVQDFQAELISVAGYYKVLEELPEKLRGQAVQARLENDQLNMLALR